MSDPFLEFFVPGVAKTQGSKIGIPYTDKKTGKTKTLIVDAAGEPGRLWRTDVKVYAQIAMAATSQKPIPKGEAIELECIFWMQRPKSHYKTGKNAGILKDNAPVYHTLKPDRTKLTRPVEDSCTGVVWHDDSQVCDGRIQKLYANEGQSIGVNVVVRRLDYGED